MGRRLFSFGLLASLAATGCVADDDLFYPSGHFDRVTQIQDLSMLQEFVGEQIFERDTTVFARWIASTR